MFWQYLVEMRVWFAILVAAGLVGLGCGCCWLLVARPWRRRAGRPGRAAEDPLGQANRLSEMNVALGPRRPEAQAPREGDRSGAAEAGSGKRIESLTNQLMALRRALSQKEDELQRAYRSKRVPAPREEQPQNGTSITETPAESKAAGGHQKSPGTGSDGGTASDLGGAPYALRRSAGVEAEALRRQANAARRQAEMARWEAEAARQRAAHGEAEEAEQRAARWEAVWRAAARREAEAGRQDAAPQQAARRPLEDEP
jgi:hypothetical protein